MRQKTDVIPLTLAWDRDGFTLAGDGGVLSAETTLKDDGGLTVVPICLPGSDRYREGRRVLSVGMSYEVGTSDAFDISPIVYLLDVESSTTELDITSDDATPKATGVHVATLTLVEPIYLAAGESLTLSIQYTVETGSSLTFYGFRVTYEHEE